MPFGTPQASLTAEVTETLQAMPPVYARALHRMIFGDRTFQEDVIVAAIQTIPGEAQQVLMIGLLLQQFHPHQVVLPILRRIAPGDNEQI